MILDILQSSLNNDGLDKSILARYIRRMLEGKVGVAQAQDLADLLASYREYTHNPKNYDGEFQELFGSLGSNFTRGVGQYAQIADLGTVEGTKLFLNGMSALETHLDDNTPLEDAAAFYGLSEPSTERNHTADEILTDKPAPPDCLLEPEDAYSAAEIAALEPVLEGER